MNKTINFNPGEQFKIETEQQLKQAHHHLKDYWCSEFTLESDLEAFNLINTPYTYLVFYDVEKHIMLNKYSKVCKEIDNPFKTNDYV